MIAWRSTWSIYTRELSRFLRTAFQSVLAPVLTTALYFIVFGAAIGGRMPDLGGVQYGVHRAAMALRVYVASMTSAAAMERLSFHSVHGVHVCTASKASIACQMRMRVR